LGLGATVCGSLTLLGFHFVSGDAQALEDDHESFTTVGAVRLLMRVVRGQHCGAGDSFRAGMRKWRQDFFILNYENVSRICFRNEPS
jgi:hypothetical protein